MRTEINHLFVMSCLHFVGKKPGMVLQILPGRSWTGSKGRAKSGKKFMYGDTA